MVKKAVIIVLALALSACGGGFDDIDAARDAGGSAFPQPEPPNPNPPNTESRWRYSSLENSAGAVFRTSARNEALNTYSNPNGLGANVRPFVIVERSDVLQGGISETAKIFTGVSVFCVPTCQIPIQFNSRRRTYFMSYNTSEQILLPANDQVARDLFRDFTNSNTAVVSLPVVGVEDRVEVQFDLRGYEANRMRLSVE